MANPDLLRKIAGASAGLSVDQFRAQDLRVAREEGLVEFAKHGAARFVRLSEKGRKEMGLLPRRLGFIDRLKDGFTWS